jgi:hypothetical protein
MNAYESLNDVARMGPGMMEFEAGPVEIWYARNPTFEADAKLETLSETHIQVGSIRGMDLDRRVYSSTEEECNRIFYLMQGEVWSPMGQARNLIRSLGLRHTSMSIGDVVKVGDDAWVVDRMGWEKL